MYGTYQLLFYIFETISKVFLTKIKIKSFECPKSIRNKKNNAWNIRHLVDELFVPATQRIILKIVGFLVTTTLDPTLLFRCVIESKEIVSVKNSH